MEIKYIKQEKPKHYSNSMLQLFKKLKMLILKEIYKKHKQEKEGFYLNMANYLNSRYDFYTKYKLIGGNFK